MLDMFEPYMSKHNVNVILHTQMQQLTSNDGDNSSPIRGGELSAAAWGSVTSHSTLPNEWMLLCRSCAA